MKLSFSRIACALCLVLALSGCGDATSSQSEDSGSSTTAESGNTGEPKPQQSKPLETQPSEAIVGEYEQEGPFSAISGGKGNEKPSFEPSGRPAPKAIVTRELKVGSGPAAQLGDEVGVYYAGALLETGQVQLWQWPPDPPATMQLGSGIWGADWEKTIEGMKVGGIRQVIIPESEWAGGKPVDYVILLKALQLQPE